MGYKKELFILGFACLLLKCNKCADNINECDDVQQACGSNADCFNTAGSYFCQCKDGFENKYGKPNFTGAHGFCIDINECNKNPTICGRLAHCKNQMGSYMCSCSYGYDTNATNSTTMNCKEKDECEEAATKGEKICGDQGTCRNVDGKYWCECANGYSNYGNKQTPCSRLNCDGFSAGKGPALSLGGLAEIESMMRNSCLALSSPTAAGEGKPDGNTLLEKLLTATEQVLSPRPLTDSQSVTRLLGTLERSILLIGPQLKGNSTNMGTTETDVQIKVQRGKTRPTGPVHLTSGNASLSTDWETAAGTGTYPGFAMAALLSYKKLEGSVNGSFEELEEKGSPETSFQVFSKVVSVVVSNPFTQNLSRSVSITLRHLQDTEESPGLLYMCAYWKESGAWSTDGCFQQQSNKTHTVCVCNHLSSFAVLMALYPIEPSFELELVTKIGLGISLLCLALSIFTFKFCRSIQGTRTTIHLHLCICLFMADLFFLAGISQVKPEAGCRFVAAMLHFFFLAVFTWMLLEGVQLYRMVVLVFNATIRPLYMYVTGYGTPLVIVLISAVSRPNGYGTEHHCWLSLEDGLIWSFFGPVCFIILVNVVFFIFTVWKLAQKFSSLNPDLSKLHKIRAFTVTAVAQMCILGLMWVFGAFLFQEGTAVMAYIFTILNSLQGTLIFIMHCLLSKQVREEYALLLSCICTPQKRYSDFSSTNPSSSQSQGSRSGQHTGESPI
ncbi:putative adhesion G protein-coupled receptor E4P [Oryzias melastigma]|uniref:Putative adhesion G protein-coupled receptor E4P n=1 Tax=Oryzias melastigma TaxID=30732 RepID=A0A3B3BI42_ORYME|nr:putative adhesion G protein-coupled receptor E4P [Oryzias melastigma]